MNTYKYNENDWVIEKKFKENVLKVFNKNDIVLNGHTFKNCILKIIKNEGKKINKECEVLEKLKDVENVSKCYGWCKDQNYTYIFLEYINGFTLEEYFLKNHPLQEKEIFIIVEQLIKILALIHDKGVIHRDLKLDNIIFDIDSNQWKFIDFNLSFSFEPSEQTSKCNTICGTVCYIPPEMRFRKDFGCRKSDIWCLGCLIIKMLGGELEEPDLNGADETESEVFIPEIPSCAPSFLKNFIQKCFFEEPVLRFDSQTLLNHPFISKFNRKGNILFLIEQGHKRWMDATQKKKNIDYVGKSFIFEDNENNISFGIGSVPEGTVELIFKKSFNQPIPNGSIPESVAIIDFGFNGNSDFNQELSEDNLPQELKSLTLGNAFTLSLPFLGSLNFLSLGRNRIALKNLPYQLETLKYYGEVQSDLKESSIPHVKNLMLPFNNGSIIKDTLPPTLKFLAWGKFKDLEAVESLKFLPPLVNDLTFSCPPEVFNLIQRKHIPDSVSILIIDRNIIELKNTDTQETFLKDNIII
ncbi:hypothetical protein RB653_007643 [Dictyostelium firmibasis]|uniref:Protein kinase domain-containing protein n=1 Tax=Dictyostelium firmibasis TaxID=79012 RepID=A0AAN7YM74_9MYCE